jgi:hypothetical protein
MIRQRIPVAHSGRIHSFCIVPRLCSDEADYAASTDLGGKSRPTPGIQQLLPLAHDDIQGQHLGTPKHFKLHLIAG